MANFIFCNWKFFHDHIGRCNCTQKNAFLKNNIHALTLNKLGMYVVLTMIKRGQSWHGIAEGKEKDVDEVIRD